MAWQALKFILLPCLCCRCVSFLLCCHLPKLSGTGAAFLYSPSSHAVVEKNSNGGCAAGREDGNMVDDSMQLVSCSFEGFFFHNVNANETFCFPYADPLQAKKVRKVPPGLPSSVSIFFLT